MEPKSHVNFERLELASEALMALASDYLSRAGKLHHQTAD